jgi:hypothetical protein
VRTSSVRRPQGAALGRLHEARLRERVVRDILTKGAFVIDASALTILLAPALGYLLRTGDAIAEEASRTLGAELWDRAVRVWDRLWPKVETEPAAKQAAEAVARSAADAPARGALEFQLRMLLEAEPALAAELGKLVEEARVSGALATAERAIAISHSNVRGVIIAGDDNVVGDQQ